MTDKPSEGAFAAGRALYKTERCGGSNLLQDFAAEIIDREAVAPTVRNLVAILARIQKRAKASPSDTDEDRKRDLYHIESLASQGLSRYRHLIEESGE